MCSRIDRCDKCRSPFYVNEILAGFGGSAEPDEIRCPHCSHSFTEGSEGAFRTAKLDSEAERNWLDECTATLPRFWLSSLLNNAGYKSEHIRSFKNFANNKKDENPHEDIREFQVEAYLKKEFNVEVKNSDKETKVIFNNPLELIGFIVTFLLYG